MTSLNLSTIILIALEAARDQGFAEGVRHANLGKTPVMGTLGGLAASVGASDATLAKIQAVDGYMGNLKAAIDRRNHAEDDGVNYETQTLINKQWTKEELAGFTVNEAHVELPENLSKEATDHIEKAIANLKVSLKRTENSSTEFYQIQHQQQTRMLAMWECMLIAIKKMEVPNGESQAQTRAN